MNTGEREGRLILVAGMHRSGTSALTRVLNLLGAYIPEPVVPAFTGNELGHWEPEAVVHMNDRFLAQAGSYVNTALPVRPAWFATSEARRAADEIVRYLRPRLEAHALVVVKDPRIALLAPVWRRAAEALGAPARFVLPYRHPLETALSLARRQRRFFPDEAWSVERGLMIWLTHVVELERATRGTLRSFVGFDALLNDWRGELGRIAGQIELPLPWEAAAGEIDTSLRADARRERAPDLAPLPLDVERVWAQLPRSAAEPGSGAEVFDAAAARLASAADLLGAHLQELEGKAEAAAGLRASLAHAEGERDAARERAGRLETRAEAVGRAQAARAVEVAEAARREAAALRAELGRAPDGELALAHAWGSDDLARRLERAERTAAALREAARERAVDARRERERHARMRDVLERRAVIAQGLAAERAGAERDAQARLEAEKLARAEGEAEAERQALRAEGAEARAEALVLERDEAIERARALSEALARAGDQEAARVARQAELEAALAERARELAARDAVLEARAREFAAVQAGAREHAAQAAQARLRAAAAEASRARDAQGAAAELAARDAALCAARAEAEHHRREAELEREARERAAERAQDRALELARVLDSRSFRLTAPLRRLRAALGR